MKKNSIASAFVLLIVGLIVVGSVVAMTGERAPFSSRVRDFVANFTGASTSRGAVRVTVQERTDGLTPFLPLRAEAAAVPTEYATGTGVAELAGGARAYIERMWIGCTSQYRLRGRAGMSEIKNPPAHAGGTDNPLLGVAHILVVLQPSENCSKELFRGRWFVSPPFSAL